MSRARTSSSYSSSFGNVVSENDSRGQQLGVRRGDASRRVAQLLARGVGPSVRSNSRDGSLRRADVDVALVVHDRERRDASAAEGNGGDRHDGGRRGASGVPVGGEGRGQASERQRAEQQSEVAQGDVVVVADAAAG